MDNTQKTFDRNQYMPPQPKPETQAGASFTAGNTATSAGAPPTGTPPLTNPDQQKKMKGYLILGGIVIMVIVIALLALARKPETSSATQAGKNGIPATQVTVIPTLDPTRPSLQFSAVANTAHSVDETFTVQLTANSQGADVNGYDILLPYDKSSLEIVEVKSLVDTFQTYQFDRGDYYAITGIKLLSAQGPAVFANQPILEFTLKGKKPGKYTLAVMPEKGKETSKFVDKDVKIIKPQFQPIIVEIQ